MGTVGSKCCSPKSVTIQDNPETPGKLTGHQQAALQLKQLEEVQPVEKCPDDDELAETAKIAKFLGSQNAQKRKSVAGHTFSKEAKCDYVKPAHAKPDGDKQTIKDTIRSNEKLQVLCGHLCEAAVMDVVMAFYSLNVGRSNNVINQGDEGDRFYIVKDGHFDIFVARKGEDGHLGLPTKVAEVGPGGVFGELALMYNAPRAATVSCVSDTATLWALDGRDFQMLIMNAQEQQKRMYEGWLQKVPILKNLNHFELSQLSELLIMELFEAGDYIIKQGEEGDKFWILEEGECRAYISGDAGEAEVKVYENPGDYFGELALLSGEPRKASVRATADSQVHYVTKDDFDAVLGPIKDILRRQIDKYPQNAKFLPFKAVVHAFDLPLPQEGRSNF